MRRWRRRWSESIGGRLLAGVGVLRFLCAALQMRTCPPNTKLWMHAPHLHNPTCRSARKTANANASSATCERAEMACEEVLDREARQHLPSSGRFKVGGGRLLRAAGMMGALQGPGLCCSAGL